ncbi:MAG: PINc/VapC family ATPase [Methanobacteriota archaeon]
MPPSPPPSRDLSVIVPDTSVIVDGRITLLIQRNEIKDARVIIPEAVISELEFQANQGRETGFNGLDEIIRLQTLKDAANLTVEFVGRRPTIHDIELAQSGEIDSIIRDIAQEYDATLLTSDAVQSHVARAKGIKVHYLKPITERKEENKEIEFLEISKYFDADTMSVHLKHNVPPYAKKGRPGKLELVKLSEKPLAERTLTTMAREIIEAAKRDRHSFVEIERHGATVVQLGPMRIAIARPPFSDGIEITAVRPVARLSLEDYGLAAELTARLSDYQRGVFVSGPPGSGKSTFAQAVAVYLWGLSAVVKTMESPRDLQVPEEITQYAPLERSMELTSDVLLLVRPDFVIYDEVRKTDDFKIFADMRLAGVGLIGVTHANRAIDAIQRLIGRVELGMIPQVVDTVIHIEKGRIQQVLDLSFTVKVPAGMIEADLARPVIEVKDLSTRRALYEIYTYGDQIVVMPTEVGGRNATTGVQRLAKEQLSCKLGEYVTGEFEVEVAGDQATVYIEDWEVPRLIGKAGRTIQTIERELGVGIDVRPLSELRRAQKAARGRESRDGDDDEGEGEGGDEGAGAAPKGAEVTPEVRRSKKNLVLLLQPSFAGEVVEVLVEGEPVLQATVSRKGEIKIGRSSFQGRSIIDAVATGKRVTVLV